jgi:hypothetical protein
MFPTVPLPTPRKKRMLREEEGLAELLSRVGKPVVFYAPDIYSEDQDEEIDDADPEPFIVFHMINKYQPSSYKTDICTVAAIADAVCALDYDAHGIPLAGRH